MEESGKESGNWKYGKCIKYVIEKIRKTGSLENMKNMNLKHFRNIGSMEI